MFFVSTNLHPSLCPKIDSTLVDSSDALKFPSRSFLRINDSARRDRTRVLMEELLSVALLINVDKHSTSTLTISMRH